MPAGTPPAVAATQSHAPPPRSPAFPWRSSHQIITERLLGLDFKVSPNAFFQSNVPCAEVLYRKIGELAGLNEVCRRLRT